jgi:hypothetical protein
MLDITHNEKTVTPLVLLKVYTLGPFNEHNVATRGLASV